ncbi:condensation domain-containing protein, partial [Skermania piniformis]|uniref:condensation domain-containing protein n=1 Tax=Skermania pinensis TaxID=39122 RepID=UPI0039E7B3D4
MPLSLAQSRMWFLNRFDPGSGIYNLPFVVRLSGVVDVDAVRAAWADVVARHEVLRTVYPEHDGVGFQDVLDPARAGVELEVVAAVTEDAVPALVAEFVGAGFDVTTGVPVRARLWPLTTTTTDTDTDAVETGVVGVVLGVVVHHISADGFSVGPLVRDVVAAYAARVGG